MFVSSCTWTASVHEYSTFSTHSSVLYNNIVRSELIISLVNPLTNSYYSKKSTLKVWFCVLWMSSADFTWYMGIFLIAACLILKVNCLRKYTYVIQRNQVTAPTAFSQVMYFKKIGRGRIKYKINSSIFYLNINLWTSLSENALDS